MILGAIQAFIEGLMPAKQESRPIGLKHFDYFSNDELLNQLAQPVFKYEPPIKATNTTSQPGSFKASVFSNQDAAPAFAAMPSSVYGSSQTTVPSLFKL